MRNTENRYLHICKLRDRLQEKLFGAIKVIKLNGCPENRHPGNLNVSIPNISGEQLKEELPNIMFSTSSACSSLSPKPSHVISALEVSNSVIKSSFRIGINKYNTMEEVDFVANRIIEKSI